MTITATVTVADGSDYTLTDNIVIPSGQGPGILVESGPLGSEVNLGTGFSIEADVGITVNSGSTDHTGTVVMHGKDTEIYANAGNGIGFFGAQLSHKELHLDNPWFHRYGAVGSNLSHGLYVHPHLSFWIKDGIFGDPDDLGVQGTGLMGQHYSSSMSGVEPKFAGFERTLVHTNAGRFITTPDGTTTFRDMRYFGAGIQARGRIQSFGGRWAGAAFFSSYLNGLTHAEFHGGDFLRLTGLDGALAQWVFHGGLVQYNASGVALGASATKVAVHGMELKAPTSFPTVGALKAFAGATIDLDGALLNGFTTTSLTTLLATDPGGYVNARRCLRDGRTFEYAAA